MAPLHVLLLSLLGLSVLVAPAPARAQTTTCDAQLTALRAAITNASSLNEKTRTGLLEKVDAAAAKLADGKPVDAVQKLNDIKATVAALSAAGKISQADAVAITSAADAAVACASGSPT